MGPIIFSTNLQTILSFSLFWFKNRAIHHKRFHALFLTTKYKLFYLEGLFRPV